MKKYNKENCMSCIRDSFTSKSGRKITVMGTHAFEWVIYITSLTGVITSERFKNGKEARKRVAQLKTI